MAGTWSVFVTFEGPEAEAAAEVRAIIDGARDAAATSFAAVSFVMGGPGMPDWDFGAMAPGWEKHEYDLAAPPSPQVRGASGPISPGGVREIVELLRAGIVCGLDPGEMLVGALAELRRLENLEGQVERLEARVNAVRRHFGGVVDGLLRKVGANGSTDPHSLDHRVAELERQDKTAGQVASATKFGSPVESPSHSERCHSCGRTYREMPWMADGEMWRKVSGGFQVLCPRCFTLRAEQLGLMLVWKPEVVAYGAPA